MNLFYSQWTFRGYFAFVPAEILLRARRGPAPCPSPLAPRTAPPAPHRPPRTALPAQRLGPSPPPPPRLAYLWLVPNCLK